jgi:hypothetical protein
MYASLKALSIDFLLLNSAVIPSASKLKIRCATLMLMI